LHGASSDEGSGGEPPFPTLRLSWLLQSMTPGKAFKQAILERLSSKQQRSTQQPQGQEGGSPPQVSSYFFCFLSSVRSPISPRQEHCAPKGASFHSLPSYYKYFAPGGATTKRSACCLLPSAFCLLPSRLHRPHSALLCVTTELNLC